MKNKYIWTLLIGIVILAVVLRFWQLGKVPISPDWDEVALGYSAYSVIHTGKDEYGKFLPVVLRSFDDYKPALYMYLTIPTILAFDLSVYAVRFPSAFFGIIGVIGVFFLIRELFEEFKYKDPLALVTSFLLAISPWDIQFSRVAFESHTGAVFNLLTALFFLKGLKKPWFFSLAFLFAGLNLYLYQSEKVFTPLFVLLLIAIFYKKIIKVPKKYLVIAALTGIIVILPMLNYLLTNKEGLMRLKGTSIFASQTEILQDSVSRLQRDKEINDKLGVVFDNRRIVFAKAIAAGYLSHFDLNWLFIRGDLARHHAPNMGLLYLWEFPFFFIGIYTLIFGGFSKKTKLFIFGWFLLAPLPASITTGVPHAVRTMNFLPTFQIFAALGLVTAIVWLSNLKLKILNLKILYIVGFLYFMFAVFNFGYYLNQYFVQQNYFNAEEWQYGWEQVVPEVNKISGNYSKIIISDKPPLDRSYMFFAFYLKYPPQRYQKETENQSGGFAEKHSFGKYESREIDWEKDSQIKNVLLIGLKEEFPSESKDFKYNKVFYYPNGKIDMVMVQR